MAKKIETGVAPVAIAPVKALYLAGFRSELAYTGAFLSILLSLTSWYVSRKRSPADKAQSDRWGIFIGHWAPTFFGLGIALRLYEDSDK